MTTTYSAASTTTLPMYRRAQISSTDARNAASSCHQFLATISDVVAVMYSSIRIAGDLLWRIFPVFRLCGNEPNENQRVRCLHLSCWVALASGVGASCADRRSRHRPAGFRELSELLCRTGFRVPGHARLRYQMPCRVGKAHQLSRRGAVCGMRWAVPTLLI